MVGARHYPAPCPFAWHKSIMSQPQRNSRPSLQEGQEEARMANPGRRQKYCSLCQKALSKVDSYLVHCHKLKRGSARFREIFQSVSTTGIIFFLLTDYSMIATCLCLPTPKLYLFKKKMFIYPDSLFLLRERRELETLFKHL